MTKLSALGAGLAGACAVTALHEVTRRTVRDAPRMDRMGMEALSKGLKYVHAEVPEKKALFNWTLASDIVSNAVYYSSIAAGDKDKVWQKGALLGLSAGMGAVFLPKHIGLNEEPSNKTFQTKLMTVGLYLVGGLVTAAALQLMRKK